VAIEAQGPVFQHRVLSEGRLVHDAEPSRRVDFESDAYVRYFDFAPIHERAKRDCGVGLRALVGVTQVTDDSVPSKLAIVRDNLEKLERIPQASYLRSAGASCGLPARQLCAGVVSALQRPALPAVTAVAVMISESRWIASGNAIASPKPALVLKALMNALAAELETVWP
jgi:hypothetical protein